MTTQIHSNQADTKMSKFVAHVFHSEWLGIKSAACSLDGHKVSISCEANPTSSQLARILGDIEKHQIKRVVFHGFSDPANFLLKNLTRAGLDCYLVWHGNFAQLAYYPEIKYFSRAVDAAKRGLFRKAHILKASQSEVLANAYLPMLPNVVPDNPQNRISAPFSGEHVKALVPGTIDIRKNTFTNFQAAISSQNINTVLHYNKFDWPIIDSRKLKRVVYQGTDAHLALLCDIDICLNVTLIDCLPMVDLEALSAGTPTITGPLFRDFLADHPYAQLTEVDNPSDLSMIRDRIRIISSVPKSELAEMMNDYRLSLIDISQMRYEEFLDL